MRLADFILANVDPIVAEWEIFARSLGAGRHLDNLALREHAGQILLATARDMSSAQTALQRSIKSKGLRRAHDIAPLTSSPLVDPTSAGSNLVTNAPEGPTLDGASDTHAIARLSLGFDLLEVMSEYRALRASVLQLWRDSSPSPDERDVDDLTRFNESVDQSLAKAVASFTVRVDQARDMFLAILSHDLRNPLSAIAMTAQILPGLGDDRQETLECGLLIARNVSVMERMISDLLDYTRTRLGAGMPVVPAPLDLALLGREIFDEYHASHPDRDIRYVANGDLHGRWDSDRVRQAISNVIGNAIQHGATRIPVTIALWGDDSNVFISVHNGGDPISPGELPRIFDPLVRGASAEHPNKNRPGSIGMGLYIAREVAKSHGGQIDVTSTLNSGTTFTLRLPRHAQPKPGQPILDAEHIRKM